MRLLEENENVEVTQIQEPQVQQAAFKLNDPINWNPVESIITNYRLYPEGTKIFYRSLTVLEMKKLAGMVDSDTPHIIMNEIIKKATKGVPVEEMYEVDKLWIIMLLRALTFSDISYGVPFKCTECGKDSHYHFTINNLNKKILPDSYDPNHVFTTKAGNKVTVGLLRTKDTLAVDAFKKSQLGRIAISNGSYDDELANIAAMITSIDGKEASFEERYIFVNNPKTLTPEDFVDITSYIEDLDVGVQPVLNVTCPKCGGASHVGLTFQPEFFIPKRRS